MIWINKTNMARLRVILGNALTTFTQLFREEHSIMANKYWVKINNNDQIRRAHWTLVKIIEQIVRIFYLNQAEPWLNTPYPLSSCSIQLTVYNTPISKMTNLHSRINKMGLKPLNGMFDWIWLSYYNKEPWLNWSC